MRLAPCEGTRDRNGIKGRDVQLIVLEGAVCHNGNVVMEPNSSHHGSQEVEKEDHRKWRQDAVLRTTLRGYTLLPLTKPHLLKFPKLPQMVPPVEHHKFSP